MNLKKKFFNFKIKNHKILDEFEKKFFFNLNLKNVKILDEFKKKFFLISK